MTDERFVLKQTNAERKVTARSARSRKCGSKTRFVSMPSDSLTPAQKRKLNGEVHTVNMNAPISYKQLRALPNTLQLAYLDNLIHARRYPLAWISDMLGCSDGTVNNLLNDLHFDRSLIHRGGRPSPSVRADFERFIAGATASTPASDSHASDSPASDSPSPEAPAVSTSDVTLTKATLTFSGTPSLAFAWAMKLLSNVNYNITIIAEEVTHND